MLTTGLADSAALGILQQEFLDHNLVHQEIPQLDRPMDHRYQEVDQVIQQDLEG